MASRPIQTPLNGHSEGMRVRYDREALCRRGGDRSRATLLTSRRSISKPDPRNRGPDEALNELRGEAKSDALNAAAQVHAIDECVLEEVGEPRRSHRLYVAHHNFCRVHETLRVTPAMQLGVTDHIWTLGELVDAALEGVLPAPGGRRYGRFTVIDGGRE
jgi:hypothetical protein